MMASGKNAKKNRSKAPVVTRKQGLPWLTIIAVVAVLALIGGIFVVVLNQQKDNQALEAFQPSASNPDPSSGIEGIFIGTPEPSATGVLTYPEYGNRSHVTADQRVAYDRFPPVGGPHDGTWAACNGVVYTTAVRDENMVHTLEHGSVWIAYNPDTIGGDLDTLVDLVDKQPFMSLTPYPGLDSKVSLQAWAHQLKVDSADDPRVKQFITALRLNQYVYPEIGTTCEQPTFDTENPPPFDPSPRGEDAVPMTGEGGTEPTDEMTAPTELSADTTGSTDISESEDPSGAPVSESSESPEAESPSTSTSE